MRLISTQSLMTLPPEMLEETFEVLLIFMYISFNITLIVNENFTYEGPNVCVGPGPLKCQLRP
jgi:hypothetical protein